MWNGTAGHDTKITSLAAFERDEIAQTALKFPLICGTTNLKGKGLQGRSNHSDFLSRV